MNVSYFQAPVRPQGTEVSPRAWKLIKQEIAARKRYQLLHKFNARRLKPPPPLKIAIVLVLYELPGSETQSNAGAKKHPNDTGVLLFRDYR